MSSRGSINSESVYSFTKPLSQAVLPPTARKEGDGIEILKVARRFSDEFCDSSRHYGLQIRATSASTIGLESSIASKIAEALRISCRTEDIPFVHGIPVPPPRSSFLISRPTDLFLGGEKIILEPGTYEAGATIIIGRQRGQLFLELRSVAQGVVDSRGFVALVGVFHQDRDPAGVDWRSTEPIQSPAYD